ncbi:MAG: hypothetical protein CYPHOPRED_000254 [Cyphobasidiales sp. Tagirdzhanova-0007]|nr:MAG: hypothetical protein CYPHOPRED_000254 [Cyphobasidiales sp. Tagirdzhanova-0007]
MKSAIFSVALAVATGFFAISSASASSVKARQQINPYYDDANLQVFHYYGSWQHLTNRGDLDYQGTASVTLQINASFTFNIQPGQQFTIYANKQANGGILEISEGADEPVVYGSASLHDGSITPTDTQAVFTSDVIERAGYITVTNKGYDKNVVVSFDYVDIH